MMFFIKSTFLVWILKDAILKSKNRCYENKYKIINSFSGIDVWI